MEETRNAFNILVENLKEKDKFRNLSKMEG
jgi:hypothetical protein